MFLVTIPTFPCLQNNFFLLRRLLMGMGGKGVRPSVILNSVLLGWIFVLIH